MNPPKKQKIPAQEKQPPLEDLEIGSAVYRTMLTNKFRNRQFWKRPDESQVLAVIPGTIQKVMVSSGDLVEPGDPLLILEAMKMRNEITAHRQGKIGKVCVETGDLVAKNQVLVEFKR